MSAARPSPTPSGASHVTCSSVPIRWGRPGERRVDPDPLSLLHLLQLLNERTRHHGIRVLPGRKDDRGRALMALTTETR